MPQLAKCLRMGSADEKPLTIREEFQQFMPFLLWYFSPGDKIENCPAKFLAVCWIVRVEFKDRLDKSFSTTQG